MYSLTHLSDQTLLRDLASLVARDRTTTAELLAHLAEVEARKLYLPAAHPSLYSYCVHELHLSEDSALKRIRAARAARKFPAILTAVAEGRLHLSGVVVLASCLTPENADELLAAAAHKSRAEIERLIAERFPRLDLAVGVEAFPPSPSPDPASEQLAPGPVESPAPGRSEGPTPRTRPAPVALQRFTLQLTMGQEMHDDLRYAQELMSHQVPSGDLAEVVHRGLKSLIRELEKRKFAAASRPRRPGSSASARHVPAHVKRAVWERDGGQCTFVSESGQRCPSRTRLEFDHVDPVARGGTASVVGIRLRCRGHNQLEAERAFGVGFMDGKREAARERREARREEARQRQQAEREAAERGRALATKQADEAKRARAAAREKAEEVIPWLRALGIRADRARTAAELCESIPEAPLEQRVRLALSHFGPRAASPS